MKKKKPSKIKLVFKNKLMDLGDLTQHISKDDFIVLLENFGFPEYGTPGFYRAIELGLVEPEYELDEMAYYYTHIDRDSSTLH
tara:strand:+ start:649 stop:897 length:249 start_codon:yes stop_codon:yes gene_type:complete